MQNTILVYGEDDKIIDRIVNTDAVRVEVRNTVTEIADFPDFWNVRGVQLTRKQYVAVVKSIAFENETVAKDFVYSNSPSSWYEVDSQAFVELCQKVDLYTF